MSKLPNPNALPESGVATKKMVADFLGVSTRTVDRLYLQGKLARVKGLGTQTVRFSVAEIRKFCEHCTYLRE